MPWEQATDPSSGKPYWYDTSAPDVAGSTTWDQPTGPAADGSMYGGAPPQPQYDMSKQPQAQPQPQQYQQQGYPPQQGQPMAQGYPAQAQPMAQPMMQGQPVMVGQTVQQHRIIVTRYRMGGLSWCLVCILILLFWPLCWLPCVCEQCQEPYQEEVIVGPPGCHHPAHQYG